MIDEIFVYTSSTENVVEGYELLAWFSHANIPFSKLEYSGDEAKTQVLNAVNTWWQKDEDTKITQPPITAFPFIIYTEAHSDKPLSYLPRKYIQGKDNIISELPALYALGR